MSRRLPPLNALRAAEAVHRAGSVAAAARLLNVSQPAVSQQLRVLEADLGQPLFRRDRGRLVPTPAGQVLLPRLGTAFAQIEEAVRLIGLGRQDGPLTVAMTPTFAMRWLIPRLNDFQQRWPAIDLRLSTAISPADKVADGTADLAISLGRDAADWPGLSASPLMPEDMFPVIAPALALGLGTPADLGGVTWLMIDAPIRAADWPAWLAAAGLPDLAPAGIRHFESSAQAIAAAVAGLGAVLAHRPFVTDDLAAGRLIQPFALTVPAPESYWLVSRAGSAGDGLRHFVDWVRAAAAVQGPVHGRTGGEA